MDGITEFKYKNEKMNVSFEQQIVQLPSLKNLEDLQELNGQTPELELIFTFFNPKTVDYNNYKSFSATNVAVMQCDPQYDDAVFQVASNHNTIESINENVSKHNSEYFATNYIHDQTQGPSACISTPFASLCRIYEKYEINSLRSIIDKNNQPFFTVKNGYVIESKQSLPDVNQFKKIIIPFQKNVQVMFGPQVNLDQVNLDQSNRTFLNRIKQTNSNQHVHQVFCTAYNIKQGHIGQENRIQDEKQDFYRTKNILNFNYLGTYLATEFLNKSTIVLTMLGGGAFGNPNDFIYQAITFAHLRQPYKYVKKVVLPHFQPLDPRDCKNGSYFDHPFIKSTLDGLVQAGMNSKYIHVKIYQNTVF